MRKSTKPKHFLSFLMNVSVGVLSALGFVTLAKANELSLEEAVSLAIERDALVQSYQAEADALDERSIADRQWPDPVVKLGLANMPVDSFALDREPMTQTQIGLQQALPRGRSLFFKSKLSTANADKRRALKSDRQRQVALDVRNAWLDVYHGEQVNRILNLEKNALVNLIGALESLYASGKKNQQDLLSAQLELSFSEDQIVEAKRKVDIARARLGQWIDPIDAKRSLPSVFPKPGSVEQLAVLKDVLNHHPRLRASQYDIDANERRVDIANEAYKPEVKLELTYGFRDGEDVMGRGRDDFASVMLMMDVPLFRKNRQDRQLSAAKYDASASRYRHTDNQRAFEQSLEQAYADWSRFREREKYYQSTILKMAKENASAARNAYQNDLVPFADLIRAQLAEFNAQLKLLDVRTKRAKAESLLIYLSGDAL